MLVAMQVINEAGMMGLVRMRGQPARDSLSLFDTATELTAGLIAVLVAIVWNRMEIEVFLLLLAVLVAGMLALKRFAEMRLRLERLVEERTEALHDKTLQLERLAARDTLTGLYNRRHADEFLLREIARARREGHPISVALADIDHFKRINDDHSHGVGDRVLERVARIFTERVTRRRPRGALWRRGIPVLLHRYRRDRSGPTLRGTPTRARARGLDDAVARTQRDDERRPGHLQR